MGVTKTTGSLAKLQKGSPGSRLDYSFTVQGPSSRVCGQFSLLLTVVRSWAFLVNGQVTNPDSVTEKSLRPPSGAELSCNKLGYEQAALGKMAP